MKERRTGSREKRKKFQLISFFPLQLEFHRGEIPKKTEENGHVAEISNEAR